MTGGLLTAVITAVTHNSHPNCLTSRTDHPDASYKSEPGHKCPTENLGQLKGCFLFARQVAWKAFGLVSTGISEEWLECCQLQLPIATVPMRKYSGISSRKAFSFFEHPQKNAQPSVDAFRAISREGSQTACR